MKKQTKSAVSFNRATHSLLQKWGWVQEMYAFTFSLHLMIPKQPVVIENFMAQPPYDNALSLEDDKPFFICHYTYTMEYESNETASWRFDKRAYTEQAPKIKDVSNLPVQLDNPLIHILMESMKEAMQSFQCWDFYADNLQSTSPQSC